MKIVCRDLFPPFELFSNKINILAMENNKAFYRFILMLYDMINGAAGDIVLSHNNVPLKLSAKAELITSFVPFEMNSRKLITKLHNHLADISVNEVFYEKTQRLIAGIVEYLYDICSYDNFETEFNEDISITSLFKCADVKLYDKHDSLIAKIIDYMLNITELEGEKLFITVNFLAYIDKKERELFYNTVIDHQLCVLLIEPAAHDKHEKINQLIIDEDFCVI